LRIYVKTWGESFERSSQRLKTGGMRFKINVKLTGTVEQGLTARSISWLTAFKVAIFAAIPAGIAGYGRRHG